VKVRSLRVAALVGVAAVGALVLSSCFGANLKLGGKHDSVLSPGVGKKVEISVKSSSSLGMPWGGMSGSLKDDGRNEAFPYGVKINFNRGVATGLASYCGDTGPVGPARRVHSIGSAVRGAGGGTTGPSDPCDGATGVSGATPRIWGGVVTYSSGDARRYPNELNPTCSAVYAYLTVYSFLGGGAPAPKSSTSSGDIVGVGAMLVFDSNGNRNVDRGDRFAFAALCGPYANIPVPGCTDCATGPADFDFYSYATCTEEGPLPGVVPGFDPSTLPGGDPEGYLGYILSELSQPNCFHTLSYGDLQVLPTGTIVLGPN